MSTVVQFVVKPKWSCLGHTCPQCGKDWSHKEKNPSKGLCCDQKFKFKLQSCPECYEGSNGPPPPKAA